ncbi:hypothetical protein BKA64DRAFT_355945 [Cadophora sp. MPI-SDFR-AT-0126]|nr:hypothetical protein BKA64DRAFT_355945 [Leotiomycetes sp. MPI-SDFR-AT-0126]
MDVIELVENTPNARPFQCDWQTCSKSFNKKSDLQRHYQIHTNERPYSCMTPGCEKKFIQKSGLIVHIRTHTGEKPHQCQYIGCGKRFADSSSFARHRRIHTRKSPNKCARESFHKGSYRKIAMVKHRRRSQQILIFSDLEDSDTSNSNSEEPSSTSQPSGPMQPTQGGHVPQQELPHEHQVPRAQSFINVDHRHIDGYSKQQLLPGNRHSLSEEAQSYSNPIQEQEPDHLIMRPTPGLPTYAFYCVSEQTNTDDTDVATLNTNSAPGQTAQTPHGLERQEALQSGRSSNSSECSASPVPQASFHTYHSAAQAATYAHQYSSPVEQQQTIQYQQQIHQCLMQYHSLPMIISQSHSQEQYYLTQLQERQWYDNTAAYQPPHHPLNSSATFPP